MLLALGSLLQLSKGMLLPSPGATSIKLSSKTGLPRAPRVVTAPSGTGDAAGCRDGGAGAVPYMCSPPPFDAFTIFSPCKRFFQNGSWALK